MSFDGTYYGVYKGTTSSFDERPIYTTDSLTNFLSRLHEYYEAYYQRKNRTIWNCESRIYFIYKIVNGNPYNVKPTYTLNTFDLVPDNVQAIIVTMNPNLMWLKTDQYDELANETIKRIPNAKLRIKLSYMTPSELVQYAKTTGHPLLALFGPLRKAHKLLESIMDAESK